jgi:hypothetical protein
MTWLGFRERMWAKLEHRTVEAAHTSGGGSDSGSRGEQAKRRAGKQEQ